METNPKIEKALALFHKVDETYKRVFLYGTGFSGPLNQETLTAHLDTMDLMDTLDDAIWNLEEEIESYEN